MINFIAKALSGEGEQNPSSKRLITFLAFLLLATGFIAELFFEKKLNLAFKSLQNYAKNSQITILSLCWAVWLQQFGF